MAYGYEFAKTLTIAKAERYLSRWEDEPPAHVSLNIIVSGFFTKKKGAQVGPPGDWREIEREMMEQIETNPGFNAIQKARVPLPPPEVLQSDLLPQFKLDLSETAMRERNRAAAARFARREHGVQPTEIAA